MSKFVPRYDFAIVLFAESLGWDHKSVLGDYQTHEQVIELYQKNLGLSWEESCVAYRNFLAAEIEEYLVSKLGPRSG